MMCEIKQAHYRLEGDVGLWAWVAHMDLTRPKTHWMPSLTEDMSLSMIHESEPIRIGL